MNKVWVLTSTVFFLCFWLGFSTSPAQASEPDSIYVKVRLSPQQYHNWLASPMKHMFDFDDWNQMSEDWDESWREHFYKWDFETMAQMAEFLEVGWKKDPWLENEAPYFRYDEKEGVLTYATLAFDENFINFMLYISAFRTLADFKDTEGPDFLVIYPFVWSPGYTVILEIGKGYTKFHTEKSVPAEFKALLEEANSHFQAEIKAQE